MIIYDPQYRRMTDTENGDYLLAQPAEPNQHEWSFNLYDLYDQPLLASVAQVQNLDELGNSGQTTLVRCVLLKAWIPTGPPEPPSYFTDYHPQITRLTEFLEAQLYARTTQTPPPRFEFIDARNQSPAPSPLTGTQVLLGLLLTGLFHLLQLLWIPLAQVHEKYALGFFYIGFTQLIYMLPAIYLARREKRRGIMIGLIIGASLTFLLGLPLAGLAFICGQMIH